MIKLKNFSLLSCKKMQLFSDMNDKSSLEEIVKRVHNSKNYQQQRREEATLNANNSPKRSSNRTKI